MTLSDVTLAITSFCRWGYLKACLDSIRLGIPEAQVIVADDSFDDRCAAIAGPDCIRLEPDSGLTQKRNAIVAATETPYWFCGADDFNFATPGFKDMLKIAVLILDTHPEVDLVGGRVNNNPYESNLELRTDADGKKYMKEVRLASSDTPWITGSDYYQKCDLVVNAFLARTFTLREVPWDNDVRPIGGEHGQFFWHLKKAGKITVWLPGLNVNTLSLGSGSDVQDPRYGNFRRRAFACGHTIMLRKEGWSDWIGA